MCRLYLAWPSAAVDFIAWQIPFYICAAGELRPATWLAQTKEVYDTECWRADAEVYCAGAAQAAGAHHARAAGGRRHAHAGAPALRTQHDRPGGKGRRC